MRTRNHSKFNILLVSSSLLWMVLNAATSRAHLIVTSTTSTAADFEELLQKLPSSSQVNISSSWLAKLDTKSLNQLQENLQERKEQSMDIPLTCQTDKTQVYEFSSSSRIYSGSVSSESNRPNSGYIFYCRVLLTCLEAANSTTTPSSKSTTAGHHVYDMKIENVKLDNAAAKEKEEEREGGQHYSSTSTTDYSLPFQFTQLTTNGSIISVQFDKDETEEVANLKKGIASSFNIRLKFDDQGKAVSSETGAFGTHNVRYSAIRSNVSSNLIAIISQYNEGDITDYSSAVKISKASFSMASKSRALWDEGAGMLKKSIERTRILFNRPPPPASYSPSAHKIKTSSQDYTERNYVNDDLDDNNSQISVYASADLIWVESIDRLHDHHEQEDSLIQGDLLDNSVILADDVSAPAMEHDKMILEEGSLVADNWIQVPSTTLDRHTLNLKKRGFPDSSSSSCYSSSLQTDTLVHRLTSSTKDHHHHRRLLQKRSLELFSSSSDHITSIMDKISSDPAKHQDLSQELLKLTRSNPELIVPHLIRRTNSATLTSTGGSRLFKRTNTFSNSSCLQEAQRSSIKPFLPHLAASGNNKAHRQLINLIKTNFDCAGQSAKIALAFAPSVSRETFEFAVDELDGENDPTHLGFFSSLLRFQTRTTAQDFLASHLERFEGIIKHSTISWSKNSSSSAAAYFNTELLDSLLSHIDSFSNLSHSQHGDLVIDALLKSTRHPSKIIQTTAIESLGQFKGDTGEMRIEEEEKKRKEEKMMETTSRSELRRREYSGSQRLQKRAIMETSQWNHGSEMYDYIVPSSEAAEDVERYPYNRGYLWGSRVGTTDINVRFSSGTFLGLPDSGCDASGFKLFTKAQADLRVFSFKGSVFSAEALAINDAEIARSRLRVRLLGHNIFNIPLKMDCSASEMPLDSQMVPVTEVEYVIPIFIFVIKLSVNVDAKLDATLDYQICESDVAAIKLTPKAEVFFEGETTVAVQGLSILRMGVKIEGNINQKLAPEARLDGEKNNKCSTCVSLIHGHDEIQFNMHGVYGGNSKGHGRETIRIMSYHRPPKELSTSSC